MTDIKPMLIGGQWRSGSHAIDNINPSNTNDLVGRYAQGNSGDMQAAITAASDALPEWSATTPQQRHDVLACVAAELTHRRDEIGPLLAREEGKPLREPPTYSRFLRGTLCGNGGIGWHPSDRVSKSM